ncbi:5-formyltetrahydrofolate cyclo-ligase [Cytobacillus sp. Hz8]|uniref:5-formyltetrahydrofolate cyclo-ligase n=1 Tax=Cytobacillus sp. Hz8 TaxID=3347168 RepID=UPI0035D6CFE2
MLDKKLLRKEIQRKLSSIPKSQYEQLSSMVASHLFKDEDYQKAETVGITISRAPEVDTYKIISRAWKDGKKIVVPKCNPRERTMIFREIQSFDQLEMVYYGLLEPIVEKTRAVEKKEIELLIVPGLGFTPDGGRLGFGGGFYDRFLQDFRNPLLALAFEEQIVSQIPMESHDIRIPKIITEKGYVKR